MSHTPNPTNYTMSSDMLFALLSGFSRGENLCEYKAETLYNFPASKTAVNLVLEQFEGFSLRAIQKFLQKLITSRPIDAVKVNLMCLSDTVIEFIVNNK